MKWITRANIKVDRVACPWLIRNFIDQNATFQFLPAATDWNSFTDGTVLARIVRSADSKPSDPHPAGEGLRWIAHGFTALGLSDHEILEREFIVYDALYAECRKRVERS